MRGVEELLADIRVGRALRRRVHARRGEERRVSDLPSSTQTEVNMRSSEPGNTGEHVQHTFWQQDYP